MNIPVSVDTLVRVDLFWKIILIDCPRRGSAALALIGSVAKDFFKSIEWSISPISSSLVSWWMFMKFFPAKDVVDIIRDELQHMMLLALLMFK